MCRNLSWQFLKASTDFEGIILPVSDSRRGISMIVLLRQWAGVEGWTNNKHKTKIWEKENEWAEEKNDLNKDRDKDKKQFLSLSVGEAWISNNLFVALLCSLPQTASSCRVEFYWLVGARDYAKYRLVSDITNNYCSQETTARKHWVNGKKVFMDMWFYLFLQPLQEQSTSHIFPSVVVSWSVCSWT